MPAVQIKPETKIVHHHHHQRALEKTERESPCTCPEALSAPTFDYRIAMVDIDFDNIFPSKAKCSPERTISGLLANYLEEVPTHVVIATHSVPDKKAGVGIFSPSLDWAFSLRLPNITSMYLTEFLGIALALRKLSAEHSQVIIVTDSFFVCSALSSPTVTPLRRSLSMLIPAHVKEIRLVWVPGHRGVEINETADYLAGVALNGPLVDNVSPIAYVVATRSRKYSSLDSFPPDSIAGCP